MQLLVGLGNPGDNYRDTRHNVGFRLLDRLAESKGLRFSAAPRFKAETANWETDGGRVLLVKPQTFMNNSGEAVAPLVHYYKVPVQDVFVVYDDLDLPAGKTRLRHGGGHGGHNGLRSLHQHLGSDAYARIKIGIGRPPAGGEVTPWVLGRAAAEDRQREQAAIAAIVDELPTILAGELARAANRIHLALEPKT
jgi:peptidyl-tRNA hydrolase, PTH1 family